LGSGLNLKVHEGILNRDCRRSALEGLLGGWVGDILLHLIETAILIDDRGIGRDVFRVFAGQIALRDTCGTLETYEKQKMRRFSTQTRELSA